MFLTRSVTLSPVKDPSFSTPNFKDVFLEKRYINYPTTTRTGGDEYNDMNMT